MGATPAEVSKDEDQGGEKKHVEVLEEIGVEVVDPLKQHAPSADVPQNEAAEEPTEAPRHAIELAEIAKEPRQKGPAKEERGAIEAPKEEAKPAEERKREA